MKKIQLTQGRFALVDDEDFEYLNKFKWFAHRVKEGCSYYAQRECNHKMIRMHDCILKRNDSEIDHADGNGLNNQKYNLRLATRSQNCANRRAWGGSKFKGVSLYRQKIKLKSGVKIYEKWRCRIEKDGKSIFLGFFKTELEAANKYNDAAIKIHGCFAKLNQV